MNAIIESIEERILALKDLKKSTKALFAHAAKEAGAFNPEKEGFRLVAADVKSLCIVYIHDTFVLPVPSRRLYLDVNPYRLLHDRYGLSTCVPHKDKRMVNGEPGTGWEIYRGPIDSHEHYRTILEEAIRFKLKSGDLVECKTTEERKRVVEAYLRLVPQEHREFFTTPEYDTQKYPNFRWANDRLNAYMDPNRQRNLKESSRVLPIDEFIKRLGNQGREDRRERPVWNGDKKPKKGLNWMDIKG